MPLCNSNNINNMVVSILASKTMTIKKKERAIAVVGVVIIIPLFNNNSSSSSSMVRPLWEVDPLNLLDSRDSSNNNKEEESIPLHQVGDGRIKLVAVAVGVAVPPNLVAGKVKKCTTYRPLSIHTQDERRSKQLLACDL